MRFKSSKTGGYQVFAVSGTNTVSFAVDVSPAKAKGLLGFAVERLDPAENQQFFMKTFKIFRSVIPNPGTNLSVSTHDHPVQSFVWDDFTAKPGRRYEYLFHPLKGKPKKLDRKASPISVKVRTEPQFGAQEHDIFFNRGVASSQAYARRFGNKAPDKQATEKKKQEAFQWLSRELDEAILAFVKQAKSGDTLLCCFYEFRYRPVADALKAAMDRGVKVRIIVDAKVNESTDNKGKFHESFPREDNLRMIDAAGIPDGNTILLREAKRSDIQHNKFMVLLRGAGETPAAIWTGSTNISQGGIFGQTNVGHWIRNPGVAAKFREYWNLLATDPGGRKDDDDAVVRSKNKAFREAVEAIEAVPHDIESVSKGMTPIFSPRAGFEALDLYADMMDGAKDLACITLAFTIDKRFKAQLKDNTPQNHLSFLLLEKKDQPKKNAAQPFVVINAGNNVYKAWGSFLKEPMHQWAKETSAGGLGLNKHVSFIHSKFLLMDPLGDDPIVVTGSANFSEPSTKANDENMLIIRGDKRVADIYFTEFNRLFNHYYFRSVTESMNAGPAGNAAADQESSLFLNENDAWLQKYQPGKLRFKRVQVFKRMKGFSTA